MNRTKRALIIATIILDFINAGVNIYLIIRSLVLGLIANYDLLWLIYDFISIAGLLVCAGLLIYSISSGGRFFHQRSGYYMAAITISVCLSFLSVATILLLLTLFVSDIVWVKPVDDVYFEKEEKKEKVKEDSAAVKERKIKHLRQMRDDGLITEEEFKDSLMKLL